MKKISKKLISFLIAFTIVLPTAAVPDAHADEVYLFQAVNGFNGFSNANGTTSSPDPLDITNTVGKYAVNSSSTTWFNPRAYFNDDGTTAKVFAGKVMISKVDGSYFDYMLRGAANNSLIKLDGDQSIYFRGSKVSNLKWIPGKWINLYMYIDYTEISASNSVCPVRLCIASADGLTDDAGNPVYCSADSTKTLDMSGYAGNFNQTGTSRNSVNAQGVIVKNSDAAIYLDDVFVYIPDSPTATLIPNADNDYTESVSLSFCHAIDMTTVNAASISVTSQGGSAVEVGSINCNYNTSKEIEIYFEESISLSGEYTINLNGIKDVAGQAIANSPRFTVDNAGNEPITAISISASDNEEQTYGSTRAVNFTASTTPAENIDVKSVQWYVNGQLQQYKGLTFSFTPDKAGSYNIYAGNPDGSVVSNTLTVKVNKAEPLVTWPSIMLIYEGNAFGDALSNDGVGDGIFTIEDADLEPSENAEGYTKIVTFTPNDPENYKTIYKSVTVIVHKASDIAYNSVFISTDDNLCQYFGSTSPVRFAADAQPRIGPDENTIKWYVNGQAQPTTGKEFVFNPSNVGAYTVTAKVANNASAIVNSQTVVVLPAEALEDGNKEYIADNFSTGNTKKWDQTSGLQNGYVTVSPDPYNINNPAATFVAPETGSTYISMRKQMDSSSPLIISGRVLMYGAPEDNGSIAERSLTCLLRSDPNNASSGSTETFFTFSGNRTIKIGGKDIGKWVDNEWTDFTFCFIPNFQDKTKCSIVAVINGGTDLSGNPVVITDSAEVNFSNYIFDSPQVQINATIRANKGGRNCIYLDDIKGYTVQSFIPALAANTNVGQTNSLLLRFNHFADIDTFAKENIHIKKQGTSQDLEIDSIIFDRSNPSYCVINLTENLQAGSIYSISFDEAIKDIAQVSPYYSTIYLSTGAAAPPESELAEIKVNRIAIYPEEFSLPLGFALPCNMARVVSPEAATNPTLEWISDDESVVVVDSDGNVTGVSTGTTTIRAVATDGSGVVSNDCTITVTSGRSNADNQKVNLGTAGSARIDKDAHLSWPQNIGEGQVALWSGNKTGAVTITVDDCITGDFPQWKAWTEEYGFPFTFFVPTGSYGSASWAEALEDMLANGEDVQSHTFNHLSDTEAAKLSTAQSVLEFYQPFEAIDSLAGGKCRAVAYSYGAGRQDYAAEFYIAARGVVTLKLNQAESANYKYISSISMDGSQNMTEDYDGNVSLEAAIKTLYDKNYRYNNSSYYGGLTCFHTHGLGTLSAEVTEANCNSSTANSFKYMFDNYIYPAKDQLWVGTFADVAAYAQERDTATLNVLSSNDNEIKYTLTDMMNDDLYDFPLTVKFKVPGSWDGISAVQNGIACDLTVVNEGSSKYVMVETIPDRGVVTISHSGSVSGDLSILNGFSCYLNEDTVNITSTTNQTVYAYLVAYTTVGVVPMLEDVTVYENKLTAGTEKSFDVTIPDDSTGNHFSLLIWTKDCVPITRPIDIDRLKQ